MPEISRFYGIVVYMFFNEHNPPHFKVQYSEFQANILIENGALLNGDLPLSKLNQYKHGLKSIKTNQWNCGIAKISIKQNLYNKSIMLRVIEIHKKSEYKLLCKFNNGIEKQLDVFPIIENHKHIQGVEKLLEENVFQNFKIGKFGEIYWSKIVKSNHNGKAEYWDYDISPEFAYFHSTKDFILQSEEINRLIFLVV